MKIVLPWPDRRLSPNARLHFRVTAGIKAKARKDAAYITYDAMPHGLREVRQHFAGEGPINYEVTFFPPDNRYRDDDNMIAMFKSARDGIADALGVNDRRFKPVYYFEEPCKPGRVEVRLTVLKSTTCGAISGNECLGHTIEYGIENSGRESVGALNPSPAKPAEQERI